MINNVVRSAAIASLLLAASVPASLDACAFHTSLPEEPLSQRIAGSVTLIAARTVPEDPFRFSEVRLLRGAPATDMPPHLVDSSTRRRLAADPGRAVLFAFGADGAWTRLLMLDETTRPTVAHMIDQADLWAGPAGAIARREFAAELLTHSDPRLRQIALQELDALDYGVLRKGTYRVPVAELVEGIAEPQEQAFAPIRILLLGTIGGPETAAELSAKIHQRIPAGIATNLGALTTAALEAGGADALSRLEHVLSRMAHSPDPDQLAEIVQALAIHAASGDPALRLLIRAALMRLAERHPDATPQIPAAFMSISDWSQSALVHDLLAANAFKTAAGVITATAYLARAESGGRVPASLPTISRSGGSQDTRAD